MLEAFLPETLLHFLMSFFFFFLLSFSVSWEHQECQRDRGAKKQKKQKKKETWKVKSRP